MTEQEKLMLINRLFSEYHLYTIETSDRWSSSTRKIANQLGLTKSSIFSFYIRTPDYQVMYEANLEYEKTLHHFRFAEHLNSETIINWMKKHEVECEETRKAREDLDLDPVYFWSDEYDKKMEEYSEKIDAHKVKLYNNSDAPKKQIDEIRSDLRKIQKLYNELYARKHSFDHWTAEDVAAKIYSRCLYDNTFYDINKKQIKGLPHAFLDNIATIVKNEAILGTQIRELAHTSPWLGYYKTAQPNPFHHLPLSSDMLQLMALTRYYEWIREMPLATKEGEIGRPSDKVIDDDDMLDGWYILYEKQKPKEDRLLVESSKFNTEQFFIAKSQEEANEIWKRNNKMAQGILKNRAEQIAAKGDGRGVKNQDLKDVRFDINVGFNKAVMAMKR